LTHKTENLFQWAIYSVYYETKKIALGLYLPHSSGSGYIMCVY